MSEEKFGCIVVGGGLAGLTAAYVLAAAGQEVLLVERGNYSGAKNMTGGRLYGHSLEQVIPGFAESAPVERRITRERLSFGGDSGITTREYASEAVASPGGESYAVLRGELDRWLSEQAEEQGAMLVYGVRVDDLLVRDGAVCGVIAGDEEMEADVVILADGVNSLLAVKRGMKLPATPTQAAVGAKEILELGAAEIEKRFGLAPGEGLAWTLLNCCTADGVCDGFLYTNKDSVSVGITLKVGDIEKSEVTVPQMLEDFKALPEIAPLITGGKLLEYSAHLIPEGGAEMIPRLYGDGVLVAGDAAALTANLGYTLRGMDLAVESGRLAAETVLAAQEKGDFSADTLAMYQTSLDESFVMPCMRGAESCLEAARKGVGEDAAAEINSLAEKALV